MTVSRFLTLAMTGIMTLTMHLTAQTFDGYTFVYSGKKAYLYDMDRTLIHTWTSQYSIVGCCDLLRDSSIIVASSSRSCDWSGGMLALTHGHFQIINWEDEVTWDYQYCSEDYMPHHDMEPVYRTNDPAEKPTFLIPCYSSIWGDKIVELRPTGATTAEVIWEWVAINHTCESNCTDKPEVFDKSKGGKGCFNNTSDAMHVNSVSYNRRLDQLVVSNKGFNEMIIIDHSTTTEEARTTSGGRYGKGGSILYRWGNPKNYLSSGTEELDGQHGCCWVHDTMPGTILPIPGAGNFLAVDNGGRRVLEIECPGNRDGVYPRNSGQPFEPSELKWEYAPNGLQGNEGSIQKLPNGNYLICTGGAGGFGKTTFGGGGFFSGSRIYEVTEGKDTVWSLSDFGTSCEGYRFAYGYLGGSTKTTRTKNAAVTALKMNVSVAKGSGRVHISVKNAARDARVSLFSADGRAIVKNLAPVRTNTWEPGSLTAGLYFVRINSAGNVISDCILIQR